MDFSQFFDYGQDPSGDSAKQEMAFLNGADKADWERLVAHCARVTFHSGDMVLKQGDRTRALFIVARGELEVVQDGGKRGPKRVAGIPAGAVFGEQAFFDGAPRSASVRAVTDGELLELAAADFEVLAAHEPRLARAILFDLGRILSLRLRETTRILQSATR